jgi:hypothetical protein
VFKKNFDGATTGTTQPIVGRGAFLNSSIIQHFKFSYYYRFLVHVPVKVQLLDVTSHASRIDVTVSDGGHWCQLTLAKHSHDLVHCGDVKQGVLVLLNNYIFQSLSVDKSVLVCLDLTIVGLHNLTIGSPTEYIPLSPNVIEEVKFVGISSEGVCSHCEQMQCEWLLYGPTIVHSVQSTHGSNPNVDRLLTNKACRHAAYTSYTRTKFGYLGKGNRVPLPKCFVNGIRDNFPDPSNNYVGFTPSVQDL